MFLQSDRDFGSIEIPTKLPSEIHFNKSINTGFTKSNQSKIEEETSDKGSSAGSSLEEEDQRINKPVNPNNNKQVNPIESRDNSPSKKSPGQGICSKIPVKRSPQKKKAPQPPKLQETEKNSKDSSENEAKTEQDKTPKTSKIPLKLCDSGNERKSSKEKTNISSKEQTNINSKDRGSTVSINSSKDKGSTISINSSKDRGSTVSINSVKKALFTSNSQLNLSESTNEVSTQKSPKNSTTEVKRVRKVSGQAINFNQQPLIESVPITVNSHIPSTGHIQPSPRKAVTSDTGTQMEVTVVKVQNELYKPEGSDSAQDQPTSKVNKKPVKANSQSFLFTYHQDEEEQSQHQQQQQQEQQQPLAYGLGQANFRAR